MPNLYLPESREKLIPIVHDAVKPYYRPLDYHNIDHAMTDTLVEHLRLIDECRQHGIEVSWEEEAEAIAASGGHDTRFYEPLEQGGPHSSKERRSCADAWEIFPPLGYSHKNVEQGIVPMIKVTEPGTTALTLPERRMRRADIKNLASNSWVFLSNSVKLYRESKLLHAQAGTTQSPWPGFVLKQQEFLNLLLKDDLSMPYETNESLGCFFMEAARINVDRLSTETVCDASLFCQKFGNQIMRLVPNFRQDDLTNGAVS